MRTVSTAAIAALVLQALWTANALAQAMTPMRGVVTSFADEFAVRVHPFNPYKHRIRVVVKVYDEKFRPVSAVVAPAEMVLGAGSSRSVTVSVGFQGQPVRRVRICTESVPFPNARQLIKAQTCGKFLAKRAF